MAEPLPVANIFPTHCVTVRPLEVRGLMAARIQPVRNQPPSVRVPVRARKSIGLVEQSGGLFRVQRQFLGVRALRRMPNIQSDIVAPVIQQSSPGREPRQTQEQGDGQLHRPPKA